MRAKNVILLVASAAVLLGVAGHASAQGGKAKGASEVSTKSEDWRERGMKARAEVPDEGPRGGTLRDPEGLADRSEKGDRGDDLGKGAAKGGKEE